VVTIEIIFFYNLQGILEGVVQFHNSRLVATAIAVVGSTEDCHYVPLVAPVVTLYQQTSITRDARLNTIYHRIPSNSCSTRKYHYSENESSLQDGGQLLLNIHLSKKSDNSIYTTIYRWRYIWIEFIIHKHFIFARFTYILIPCI